VDHICLKNCRRAFASLGFAPRLPRFASGKNVTAILWSDFPHPDGAPPVAQTSNVCKYELIVVSRTLMYPAKLRLKPTSSQRKKSPTDRKTQRIRSVGPALPQARVFQSVGKICSICKGFGAQNRIERPAPKGLLYSFRDKITVIARCFLPKQSLGFQRIASLRNARNDR
jgi:hypothetical protein